jgi:hypothetical protein
LSCFLGLTPPTHHPTPSPPHPRPTKSQWPAYKPIVKRMKEVMKERGLGNVDRNTLMHPKTFLQRRLAFDPDAGQGQGRQQGEREDSVETLQERFAEGYLEYQVRLCVRVCACVPRVSSFCVPPPFAPPFVFYLPKRLTPPCPSNTHPSTPPPLSPNRSRTRARTRW